MRLNVTCAGVLLVALAAHASAQAPPLARSLAAGTRVTVSSNSDGPLVNVIDGRDDTQWQSGARAVTGPRTLPCEWQITPAAHANKARNAIPLPPAPPAAECFPNAYMSRPDMSPVIHACASPGRCTAAAGTLNLPAVTDLNAFTAAAVPMPSGTPLGTPGAFVQVALPVTSTVYRATVRGLAAPTASIEVMLVQVCVGITNNHAVH